MREEEGDTVIFQEDLENIGEVREVRTLFVNFEIKIE